MQDLCAQLTREGSSAIYIGSVVVCKTFVDHLTKGGSSPFYIYISSVVVCKVSVLN